MQAGIDRYLAALTGARGALPAAHPAFVEVGGGYDSNANAGVAQADIGLPVLGPVTVDDFGVAARSRRSAGSPAAAQIHHPVAPGVTVNASVYGGGTFYFSVSEFNLAHYGADARRRATAPTATRSALTYAHGEIVLDGALSLDRRRRARMAPADSELSSFALAPQYARIGYAGDNAARDADF